MIANKKVYNLLINDGVFLFLPEYYDGNLRTKFFDWIKKNHLNIHDMEWGSEYNPESTQKLKSYIEMITTRSKIDKIFLLIFHLIVDQIIDSNIEGLYEILIMERYANRAFLFSLYQGKKSSWLLWEKPVYNIRINIIYDVHFRKLELPF